MRRIIFMSVVSFFVFSGCKSSKSVKEKNTEFSKSIIKTTNDRVSLLDTLTNNKPSDLDRNTALTDNESNLGNHAIAITAFAKQFEGVKYKFGGTTKKGMDCSGLVYESFNAFNIQLPRISRDMAKEGKIVMLDSLEVGDLLFFKTNRKRNTISHVGLVVTALPGNIEFIHATTSQGVIISSLAERYWYFSFAEARRML